MCICINMIKNRLFIFTWPLIAVACNFLLWPYVFWYFHDSLDGMHLLSIEDTLHLLNAYVIAISTKWLATVCACIGFTIFIWSYIRWFKNPCKKTLLLTMFTTWIVCGFPGLWFLFAILRVTP